ncbi:hypothetical protein KWG76_06590 [Haloterrigena longa]|uniref:Uncharacterized protein n=1 Tax=Natrinema longum TaxID=370324 RepID=A0A8A2U649_9EURY|nr:hypothetical protein [Natrinema longum]MBZ6494587.1 hypothetical protein [Natrinema longum]QSW84093.1 hypothetical protein J0X27_11565 [Natrinema longum]
MFGLRNRSPRQRDSESSTTTTAVSRRRVLQGGAVTTVLTTAGCLGDTLTADDDAAGDDGSTDDGSSSDDDSTNAEGDDADSDEPAALEDELRPLIDDYLDAAAAEDTETIATLSHGSSPLHPGDWEEAGWEFQGDAYADVDGYEIERVAEDAAVEDVSDLEFVEFWFEDDGLAEAIGSEEIAIVEVASDDLEAEDLDVWVFVTEDEEWKVFFVGTEDETPADPTEAFEEPIEDEENDVVAKIDWEFDQDNLGEETEWARVHLTDSPGVDADTVRIESTIAGTEMEFYNDETGAASSTWAGATGTVELNPDGDQIVVTAIDGDDERVVHRQHYEP